MENMDEKLKTLTERLDRIEEFLTLRTAYSTGSVVHPPRQETAPSKDSRTEHKLEGPRSVRSEPQREPADLGNFLGVIAVVCFVLAASFLIKLSIDSGWLTPVRQVVLASAFGLFLVAVGLRLKAADATYLSLLPAAGIITLYLAVAGGHSLYGLYSPEAAVALASGVSVLSIGLFAHFRNDLYVGISVVGTYLSLTLFKGASTIELTVTYFLIWDITFATLAVLLKSRAMILLAAYMALGLIALWTPSRMEPHLVGFFALVQGVQFIIFLGSVVGYALRNRIPLSTMEALAFFPILMFFYGIQYASLSILYPDTAPYLALVFAALIYGVYEIAKRFLGQPALASSLTVSSVVSLILLHALYFQILPDRAQVLSGLVVMALLGGFHRRWDFQGRHFPILAVGGFVIIAGYVRTITAMDPFSTIELVGVGLAYSLGLGIAYFSRSPKEQDGLHTLVLLLANGQFLWAVYRIWQQLVDVGVPHELLPFGVSTTWGVFAVVLLLWGKRRLDSTLAYAALGILALATAKVFLSDLAGAAPIVRILGLLALGAILFFCGYQLRSIGQWGRVKSP